MTSSDQYMALTTTFTPASNCSQNIGRTEFPICSDGEYCGFFYVGPTTFEPECYPDGNLNISYYSPGVCPYGYPAACTSGDTVTTMTCCQDGYSCIANFASDTYSRPWDAFFICTSTMDHSQELAYTTSVLGLGYVVSTLTTKVTLHAFGYVVEFTSGEIPPAVSSSASAATPASVSATSTATASSQPPTSGVAATGGGSGDGDGGGGGGGGLSTGAKVGVGVGVGVGGLLLLALLFLFVRRQRRRHGGAQQQMGEPKTQEQQQQPQQYASPCVPSTEPAELASTTHPDSAYYGSSPRIMSWVSGAGTLATATTAAELGQHAPSPGPHIPPVVEAP